MGSVHDVSLQSIEFEDMPETLQDLLLILSNRFKKADVLRNLLIKHLCMFVLMLVQLGLFGWLLAVLPMPWSVATFFIFLGSNAFTYAVISNAVNRGLSKDARKQRHFFVDLGTMLGLVMMLACFFSLPTMIVLVFVYDRKEFTEMFPNLRFDPRFGFFKTLFERVGNLNHLIDLVHEQGSHTVNCIERLEWLQKLSDFEAELRVVVLETHRHLTLHPPHKIHVLKPEVIERLEMQLSDWHSRLVVLVAENQLIFVELVRQEEERNNAA